MQCGCGPGLGQPSLCHHHREIVGGPQGMAPRLYLQVLPLLGPERGRGLLTVSLASAFLLGPAWPCLGHSQPLSVLHACLTVGKAWAWVLPLSPHRDHAEWFYPSSGHCGAAASTTGAFQEAAFQELPLGEVEHYGTSKRAQ